MGTGFFLGMMNVLWNYVVVIAAQLCEYTKITIYPFF